MRRRGDRLREWAARWCDPQTMATVIDPMIADLQLEHTAAVERRRRWESVRIRLVFVYAFLKVAVACAWRDVASPARWTRDERKALWRTLMWSTLFVSVLTVWLELPPLALLPKTPWAMAFATLLGYYLLLFAGRVLALKHEPASPIAAWLPKVVFVLMSVAPMALMTHRRPIEIAR